MSLRIFLNVISQKIRVINLKSFEGIDTAISNNEISLFIIDFMEYGNESSINLLKSIRSNLKHSLSWILAINVSSEYHLSMYDSFQCYKVFEDPYEDEEIMPLIIRLIEHSIVYDNFLTKKFLAFYKKGKESKISLESIVYAEIYNKNCTIYTKSKCYNIGRMPLSQLESQLSEGFLRCHRSYIINSTFPAKISE
jgi:DNA-binding LytR/AlgR family response regulator